MKGVPEGQIKVHRFMPSGRCIWTVIGREAEHWMAPSLNYCSCPAYYYNSNILCYHLKCASNKDLTDYVDFSDDEFDDFISALLQDVLVTSLRDA
ncbi:MAG: hypothetical protein F4Y82_02610 [Cenarchaeum sp. SB0665_bin_23]|nr:hypothetical protein [Cenarchaeum sp. SB0664_bin_35]MXY60992.1 hypothetical protein [Cenarchaeum sp. SB0665_bin_23]MXZ93703.1 hypothetical protein [Cenarchaeum sp. SB0666_bin_15]MYB46493.1 hypothetical protein [Cenarchaeum sp. SB0662_bin_33]MYD58805.1 hypothetical protein [Cenarchaeum sp. SB0678_bin_8]MYG33411.1 hypothetical protein [Cenarchaeum sp. SB0677_bin_16]MYJ27362.1 hypothetical protein [Cenarchaeum sp. SB0672_bin_9]